MTVDVYFHFLLTPDFGEAISIYLVISNDKLFPAPQLPVALLVLSKKILSLIKLSSVI